MDWTGSFNPVSLVSGGFQALGNYFAARQQAKDNAAQRRFEQEMWQNQAGFNAQQMERQNEMTLENQELAWQKYDSPVAQRRAMTAAGMNPFVEGSALQPGVSSAQPGANAASASMAHAPAIGSSKYEAMMAMGDAVGKSLLLSADIELKKSEARKNNAAAQGQENANSVFDVDRENKIRDAVANKSAADATIAEADAQYQTIKNAKDMEEREQRIAEAKKRIEQIGVQNDLTREQIDLVRQEFFNKLAEEGYIIAKTKTEDATRAGKVRKLGSEADLDEANKKRIESLTPSELAKNYAEIDLKYLNRKSITQKMAIDALKLILDDSKFSDGLAVLSPSIKAGKYGASFGTFDLGGYVRRIEQSFSEERAAAIKKLLAIALDVDNIDTLY